MRCTFPGAQDLPLPDPPQSLGITGNAQHSAERNMGQRQVPPLMSGTSSPDAHITMSLLHRARERAGTPGSTRPGLSSLPATGEPSDLGPVSSSLRAQTPLQKSGSSSAHGAGGQCEADGVQHVPLPAHRRPHPCPLQRQQTVSCFRFRASE